MMNHLQVEVKLQYMRNQIDVILAELPNLRNE